MARRPPPSTSSSDVRAIVTDRFRRRLARFDGTTLEGADTGARLVLDALEAGEDVTVNGMYVPADIRPGGIQGLYRISADGTITAVPWTS